MILIYCQPRQYIVRAVNLLMNQNKLTIRQICIWAMAVRFLALLLIVIFSDNLTIGFIGSDIVNDDVRYLTGGKIYANTALSLIDTNAFVSAFSSLRDWVGYGDLQIWYWFVCVGMYLFHDEIVLRIINIIFAVYTVKCIYDISNKIYGKEVATIASVLYALLPYTVLFSCFLYKDQLYTLVTLMLLRNVILNGNDFRIRNVISLILGITLSLLLRSGLVVAIAVILLYIIKKEGHHKLSNPKLWIPIIIIACSFIIFVIFSYDRIIEKITAYILEYDSTEGRLIKFFSIKSPLDLYRYPFSLLFLMVLPLNMGTSVTSWCDLVSIFNVVSIPIAIGNFFYLLNWKIRKNYFFWTAQILFLITIITSLGILRHSYYLQPFSLIFFADFITRSRMKSNFVALTFIIVFFYLLMLLYWISLL